MTTTADIKAAIVSIITAQVAGVRQVYNYEVNTPAGYPSISVVHDTGSGQFLDTTRNRRSFIYRIRVLQERIKVGESEAERITTQLYDQLLTVFDDRNNITLNNTCIFAYPIPSKWGYFQAPEIDNRTAEILLEAITAA